MAFTVQPSGRVSATVSHQLTEETLADVAKRVTEIGAGIGSAGYSFNYSWSTDAKGKFSVELTLSLSMALPVWDKVSKRPEKEQNEWKRFLAALRDHEEGHHELYKREGKVMYDTMLRANSKTVARVFQNEKQRIARLDRAYDQRTKHGVEQNGPNGNTVINVP